MKKTFASSHPGGKFSYFLVSGNASYHLQMHQLYYEIDDFQKFSENI